jgi:predicted RNase H-like nuclease
MRVLGLDACRKGWVGVALDGGRFDVVRFSPAAEPLLDGFEVVGVDIPIGTVASGLRACDADARAFVGVRRNSVFPALPASALHAASYADAAVACRASTGKGLTQQSWRLAPKTREIAALCHRFPLYEVHPEVSFRALHGEPLPWAKTTWNGLALRRRLLADAGVMIPDLVGAAGGLAGPDDVLDAAVAAWSAARIAAGDAESLPAVPEQDDDGRLVAIWF